MDIYLLGKQYKISRINYFIQRLFSISKIQPGGRWCTSAGCAQDPGLWTSLYRTLPLISENKVINLKDIMSTVSDAIELIHELEYEYIQYNNQVLIQELKLGLYMAQHGISNLKITYYDCEETLRILDNLLKCIYDELISYDANVNYS